MTDRPQHNAPTDSYPAGLDSATYSDGAGSEPALDERLARETRAVAALSSGTLRLADERRWFWTVIVPHRAGATELHHLPAAERSALMEDAAQLSEAVAEITKCQSVNIAMLGNVVPQLHLHVVARHADDPAWPGPVWGHGEREPLDQEEADRRMVALRDGLGLGRHGFGKSPSRTITR